MCENRKKPVWPRIVAILIGLAALYVASFGPACWMVKEKVLSAEHVAWTYRPLVRQIIGERGLFGRAIWSYGEVCGGFGAIGTVHNYGVSHSKRGHNGRAVH
jgi:hypothetical protein